MLLKFTAPTIVKHLRSQGLRALLYLNDGIVAVKGKEAAVEASRMVRQVLAKAGLVEHAAKCMWDPSQVMEFTLDLAQGRIWFQQKRLKP